MRAQFRDPELYDEAITHRSWANERGGGDYERLEFLGDAVLQLCVTEALVKANPQLSEGQLTFARQRLVDEPALAPVAVALDLPARARLGVGASRDGTVNRPSVQAALFEALLGAVYLDRGLEAARELVARHVLPRMPDAVAGLDLQSSATQHGSFSPVQVLQEWSQREHKGAVPSYDISAVDGPDHDRRFLARVSVAGEVLAEAWGNSKKGANAAAAAAALDRLGVPW